jgi:hypothetical protein
MLFSKSSSYAAIGFLMSAVPIFSAAHEIFNLQFNDSTNLGTQTGLATTGTLYGDVHTAADFSGAADFGTTGRIQFPGFVQPKGNFSIEARFRIRDYFPSDPFISDLVNTGSWVGTPPQGFAFRVGAGYFYPPLPRAAYASDAEYQAALALLSVGQRADLGKCLGDFAIAVSQGSGSWKEIITDRCVERNRWIHMVATWDGQNSRLYMDGWDVTDPWRNSGVGLSTKLDSTAPITVGARYLSNSDGRHFNGLIDFARIVDTAMSAKEIRNRYWQTLSSDERTRTCATWLPSFPVGGRFIRGDGDFCVRSADPDHCGTSWHKGDSIDVEFSRDAAFDTVFASFPVTDTVFKVDARYLQGKKSFEGQTYWRTRPHSAGVLKKSAAVTSDWSLPATMVLSLDGTPTSLTAQNTPHRIVAWKDRTVFLPEAQYPNPPTIFGLDGKAITGAFTACSGGWCLQSMPSAVPSVFFVK